MSFVANLDWRETGDRIARGVVALLPIGAGAKEHGLHMPMNTDAVQAEWLAAELDRRVPLLVWPTLTYGYYPAFRDFPGSISLSRATFAAAVREIAGGILRHGAARLFVLDTGISTIEPVSEALADFGGRAVHLRIHAGPRCRAAADRLATQAYGSHADELETSRMLAIAPDIVRMERAEATPSPAPFEGPLTRVNAPSGSYGDPARATAEKGRELIAAMLNDLEEEIRRPPSPG